MDDTGETRAGLNGVLAGLRDPACWRAAFPGLLLLIAILAIWWPAGLRWRSDDLLATAYASDFSRVLMDFHGPQYGATDIWLFFRPLITLAFWLERTVYQLLLWPMFGASATDEAGLAFFAMLTNVLAHGCTAILLWRIWTRFTDNLRAWCIALAWAVVPTHIEALWWGVGRVDSHTHVWIALSLLCFCRWLEFRSPTRIWALLTGLLALASKEQAVVIAPLAFLLAMLLPGREPEGRTHQRLLQALRRSLPLILLVACWLALRAGALGVALGGYTGNSFDLANGLGGLFYGVIRVLNPMTWLGQSTQAELSGDAWPAWVITLGFLPCVIGLGIWCSSLQRLRALPWFAITALISLLPVFAFWSQPSLHNLRYYYTATWVLAALPAAGRLYTLIPVLLVWWTPMMDLQTGVQAAAAVAGNAHDRLLDANRQLREDGKGDGPVFCSDMPRAVALPDTPHEFIRCLHYGVDRMLQPPFTTAEQSRRLYPLRTMRGGRAAWDLPSPPWTDMRGALSLELVDDQGQGLGWGISDPGNPDLPSLTVQKDGFEDLRSPSLQVIGSPESNAALVTPGVWCRFYRVTMFTGVGYVTAVVQNAAPEGSADGRIRLWDWIVRGSDRRPTPLEGDPDQVVVRVVFQLLEPTVADLDPTFAVLVEGGDVQKEPGGPFAWTFGPTHRARRLVTVPMDRGFSPAVREAMGWN